MKEIQLTQGKVALVDDEDFDYLNQFKWYTNKCGHGYDKFYAVRLNKHENVHMHRLIMNTPDGFYTDHIDGDGLNNQKNNLRICTSSQNQANKKKCKNNNCGFKGVHLDKPRNKWKATIHKNNKTIFLGRFDTPQEAAKNYDKAARKYFGEFAELNFGGKD